MKCPNCSNEVPETANVCGYCGQRLKAAAPPPQPVYAEPRAKRALTSAAQRGTWWEFGLLLLGAVMMTIHEWLWIFRGFSAPILDILALILLAFTAISSLNNGRRDIGLLIGFSGLGLLVAFVVHFLLFVR